MEAFVLQVFTLVSLIVNANSNGQFYVGFLDYANVDNLDYKGMCCDGEMSNGKCTDYCDLIFEVSVLGIDSAASTGRRPSETPIDNDNAVVFPSSYEGVINPLTFDFQKWPGDVNVTVKIYDVDDGKLEQMVDTFFFRFKHSGPSIDFIYKEQHGQRNVKPSELRMVFRYECDPSYYGLDCFTDCLVHPNEEECPLYPGQSSEYTTKVTDWHLETTTPKSPSKCKDSRNPMKPSTQNETLSNNMLIDCKNRTSVSVTNQFESSTTVLSESSVKDERGSTTRNPSSIPPEAPTTVTMATHEAVYHSDEPSDLEISTENHVHMSTNMKTSTHSSPTPSTIKHLNTLLTVSTESTTNGEGSPMLLETTEGQRVSSSDHNIIDSTDAFVLESTIDPTNAVTVFQNDKTTASIQNSALSTEKGHSELATDVDYNEITTHTATLDNIDVIRTTEAVKPTRESVTRFTTSDFSTNITPVETITNNNSSKSSSSLNSTDSRVFNTGNAYIAPSVNTSLNDSTVLHSTTSSKPVLTDDKSDDDGMKYWPAIVGAVLGALAILGTVAVVMYYRKQKEMQRRQDIYNVNPKTWALDPQENGTTGRSEVALETEHV